MSATQPLPGDHVMVDLECMSCEANGAITALGASLFMGANAGQTFYRSISLTSAVAAGGHIQAETVEWWLKQDKTAQNAMMANQVPITDALCDFGIWLSQYTRDPHIWGNGVDFDNVILCSAYKNAGIKLPWSRKKHMCYRTLKRMYMHTVPAIGFEGVKHDALADAVHQGKYAIKMLTEGYAK